VSGEGGVDAPGFLVNLARIMLWAVAGDCKGMCEKIMVCRVRGLHILLIKFSYDGRCGDGPLDLNGNEGFQSAHDDTRL